MGKSLERLNSRQRQKLFEKWKQMTWKLQLTSLEVRTTLLEEKENLHQENIQLRNKLHKAEQAIMTLKHARKKNLKSFQTKKRKPRKSWSTLTARQKRKKIHNFKAAVSALSDDHFEVVEVQNKETGSREFIGQSSPKKRTESEQELNELLYVKEKHGISNAAYHELSMVCTSLPRSWKVKDKAKSLNKKWAVTSTSEGTVGVQQPLEQQLCQRVERLLQTSSTDEPFRSAHLLHVKLTGDGTNIGRGLHVVNFGFTVLEEGSVVKAASGNHTLCILREPEQYDKLALGLQDIHKEVALISKKGITVGGEVYNICFYLGGDWKFLASICGLDAANSTFACIWCLCPKQDRYSLEKQWSIRDVEKGARTVESIIASSKLPKRSTQKHNCSHEPLFPTIPIHHVIIDNLHLFLRVMDTLINLLILELRRQDGIERATLQSLNRTTAKNVAAYESFLNNECQIPFQFYISDSKTLKWRDLTGPEKYRLLRKIQLPLLFPNIPMVETLQEIWNEFSKLNACIRSDSLTTETISAFESDAQQWLKKFLSVYQTKHVTPYIHALVAHVPEFLRIHRTIAPFTQQGLEKLNDQMTRFYFGSSNHRGTDALTQVLQKKNRLEHLHDEGYERKRRRYLCSLCGQPGHNRKTCLKLTTSVWL